MSNNIDGYIDKLRSDAIFHSYNFQGYSMQEKNEIANYLEELKVTRKALNMVCDRLGWLEHDCKGCTLEVCDNYVNDKKYSELIEETCLRRAKECSELIKEAYLQKAKE